VRSATASLRLARVPMGKMRATSVAGFADFIGVTLSQLSLHTEHELYGIENRNDHDYPLLKHGCLAATKPNLAANSKSWTSPKPIA